MAVISLARGSSIVGERYTFQKIVMRLYKHNTTSELIEFVGLNTHEYVFRYVGDEFKNVFFHVPKAEVEKYWSIYDNSSDPS